MYQSIFVYIFIELYEKCEYEKLFFGMFFNLLSSLKAALILLRGVPQGTISSPLPFPLLPISSGASVHFKVGLG